MIANTAEKVAHPQGVEEVGSRREEVQEEGSQIAKNVNVCPLHLLLVRYHIPPFPLRRGKMITWSLKTIYE